MLNDEILFFLIAVTTVFVLYGEWTELLMVNLVDLSDLILSSWLHFVFFLIIKSVNTNSMQ